ncbi:MAG: hypothetical protein ACXACI_18485 [Candidatus Hodarchaeales archaeon]
MSQDFSRMMDKAHQPTEEEILSYIGEEARAAWLEIIQFVEDHYDFVPETHTMNFVKSTTGWGSDVGARWYANSEQSSPSWLIVPDVGIPS